MQCIKCGKKEAVMDYLCIDCYFAEHQIIQSVPTSLKINRCRNCQQYFSQDYQGQETSLKKILRGILQKKIKYNKRALFIKKINLDIQGKTEEDNIFRGRVSTELEVFIHDHPLTLPYIIKLQIKPSLCQQCAKLASQYYEGMLQIRQEKKEQKQLKEVIAHAKRFLEQHHASITNIVEHTTGIDLYITHGHYLKELAYFLRKQFGGEVKINASLFSHDKQRSKNIYRITALFRLPEFHVHDIMITEKRMVLIKEIKNHRVLGINLLNWKRSIIDYKEIPYEIIKQEAIKTTTISKTSPHIEALDPDDFQSKVLVNAGKQLKLQAGQKVKVTKIAQKLYLVKW